MVLLYLLFLGAECIGAAEQGSLFDSFEGDIVWDDHVAMYYSAVNRTARAGENTAARKLDRVEKRDAGQGLEKRDAGQGLENGTSYTWIYSSRDNEGSLSFTIPYDISAISDSQAVVYIKIAMKEWNKETCVLFVPRSTEDNFVNIVPGSSCSSHVGMRGGGQDLRLDRGCQYNQGAVMHELGHVIGLFHEHTRKDRDSYVDILYENLVNGTGNRNFRKMLHNPAYVRSGNYDYISIMHYGKTDFSVAPYNLTTIRTLDPAYQDAIGQRTLLSSLDVEKVNTIYNCGRLLKYEARRCAPI